MKESRFIELLNLYIDQQITPEDAAQLEEDILANPRHRRTYQQYCRMHRACTLVFANAHAGQTAGGDHRRAGGVVPFEPAGRRSAWKYYAAGLAAAACLAFVGAQVFLRPARVAPGDSLAVVPAASPAPLQPVRRQEPGAWRLDAPRAPLAAVSFATVSVPDRTADPLRPSVEEFVFEQMPAGPSTPATFRSRPQTRGEEEMAAFQFQR